MSAGPFALTVLPEIETLAHDERRGAFVLRVDPPEAAEKRPPLRLVLALDTSGSMDGEKLQGAVASAQAIVRALSPEDTFGCVTFDSHVTELLSPTAMTASGKALTHERLARAVAGGNTNLGAAMLRSLEAAAGGRVLLLTDGCPTEGVSNPDQLAQLLKGALGGSTLSTFGFGRDVNPLLLLSLAEVGRGNYTFIEPGEPPLSAIAAELGGLVHTVGAEARIVVRPSAGVRIDKVHRSSGVRFDNATGSVELELATLIASEPVYLALELSWDEAALGRPLGAASIEVRRTDTGERVVQQAVIQPRHAGRRGPVVAEAARELLLARASVLLAQASRAPASRVREIAAQLGDLHAELRGMARVAGLEADEQVVAALGLLKEAQTGLTASSDREVHSTRQDMVTSALALSQKRSTMMGLASASRHAAFASKSQKAGWDMVGQPAPGAPDSKKKP